MCLSRKKLVMNKTLLPKEEWRNYSKKLSKKCFKKLTDQKLHSTLTFSSEKKKKKLPKSKKEQETKIFHIWQKRRKTEKLID